MNSPRPCISIFLRNSFIYALYLLILLLATVIVSGQQQAAKSNQDLHEKIAKKMGSKNEPLPPCLACRTLVNSFKKGLENTARGKFEGGDADWEESRLGNYATSELRLVEIQEQLCSDLDKGQEQCHTYAENHEAVIEEWWFKKRKNHSDLHAFLCIENLKVCCPPNHFGPECKPCIGGPNNPCNGHGKCKGNGTRKGSGVCKCDDGYTGSICDTCAKGYFLNDTKSLPPPPSSSSDQNEDEQRKDEKEEQEQSKHPASDEGLESASSSAATSATALCSKCHKSCLSHCREAGPKGCEVCADGYQHLPEYGCTDVDECIELGQSPCSGNTFCANTDGSYICMDCDKVCNGCNGDGPDMCLKCADDFSLKDGVCVESAMWKKSFHANIGRYVTYIGFFIATFIIYKRNQGLAYIVGAIVAAYMGVAEYLLGNWEELLTFDNLKSSLNTFSKTF